MWTLDSSLIDTLSAFIPAVQLPAGGFAAPQAAADGSLLVTIAGGAAVINVDLAEVDVAALVAGIANGKTLSDVHAKLSSDPASQTTLAAVLAKLSADPATQTTLAAVLAKLSADPATQTTLAAVLAAVQLLAGSAVTFSDSVLISQAVAGRTTIMAAEAGKVIRLHELLISADATGTVYIAYDDDGAGLNEVKLDGARPVAANGSPSYPWRSNPYGCLKTPAGKYLTLVSATSKVFGHAIVSKATS